MSIDDTSGLVRGGVLAQMHDERVTRLQVRERARRSHHR
jgi:hypothetical protein